MIGGTGLPLMKTDTTDTFVIPTVSSSKEDRCPIVEFSPFISSDVNSLAFSSANLTFVDPNSTNIVSEIIYRQDVPYINEFIMRASMIEGDIFGIYNYYSFKIIVCGAETFILTNTTEYRQ
jgi:hypothetical protein